MSFFDRFSKKPAAPSQGGDTPIYDFLFCDNLDLYRQHTKSIDDHPWNVLFAKTTSQSALQSVIDDDNMESRLKILAYNRLLATGYPPASKELLGIIVEVGLDQGVDVLAAYRDGRARYINYSGKIIVWESATPESTQLIDNLFLHGETVKQAIGPSEKPRRPKPPRGTARLTLLVSDGLYFGEGPINLFFNDALAGPVLAAAAALMKYLTEKAMEK